MKQQHQAQPMAGQPAVLFAAVPLAKRVSNWLERSEGGIFIDIISAALSMLTVFTYMVETRYSDRDATWIALRIVDQICAVIFAAEWCFWLWLARNRLRYITSWQSLVDIATIVPLFLSLFISHVAGFATFEAMVRIFRVVRVFRIFRLGKRLKSEVQSKLLTLVFTLVAIIVTGAGIFYELETRFSDKYPDLTIEQAIYWSVVTTTTIGYGDISPSITASQMTLLAMLLIAFTLLPYQTSMLVNALSETSVYQSAHYSRASKGRHVVVTGYLAAASAGLIVDELFHQDSGFSDYHVVFLSPCAPNDELKRLLKMSRHAHRLLYLQGSWAVHEDLARAEVDACEAVFILCDKAPTDAQQEDLRNTMACIAIGQYIQLKKKAKLRPGPKPLRQRLHDMLAWLLMHFYKVKEPSGIPHVCIQLLLPESQRKLYSLLDSYSSHGLLSTGVAAAGNPTAEDPQQASSKADLHSVPLATTAGSVHEQHLQSSPASVPIAEVVLQHHAAKQSPGAAPTGAGSCNEAATNAAAATRATATDAFGAVWWQRFSRHLTCICVAEVRYGLLAECCLGCSGATTLVSNLIRSVDDGVLLASEFNQLPEWAQEYLEGSSNEIYEVAAFPGHFHGVEVMQLARYLLDVHRAVLLATAGTSSTSSSSTRKGGACIKAVPEAGQTPAAVPAATQQQVQQQPGSSSVKQHVLQLAPLSVHHTITQHTSAYVIASDVRVVLDIMECTADDYNSWQAAQHQLLHVHSGGKPLAKHSMTYTQPAMPFAPKPANGSIPAIKNTADLWPQQLQQKQPHDCLAGAAAAHQPPQCTWQEPQTGGSPISSATLAPWPCSEGTESANPVEAGAEAAAETSPAGHVNKLEPSARRATYEAHGPNLGSDSATSSRRTTTERSSKGGSFRAGAAALMGSSAKALLAALPGGPASEGGGLQLGAGHMKQRRHRGSIKVNTRAPLEMSDSLTGPTDYTANAAASKEQPHIQHCLPAPSWRQRAATQQWEQLYHVRQPSNGATSCLQDMVQEEVHLQGHVLICGWRTPPAALSCLLQPLRSTALPVTQPIVVLDSLRPAGSDWELLARLDDVYYVEGSVHDADQGLIRANAAAASIAVVLLPWQRSPAHGSADADSSMATDMVDALMLYAVRAIRSMNPSVKVFTELSKYQSLAFLDPIGSLLDCSTADLTAVAAATPAFMSGAVLVPLMVDSLMCQAVYNRGTPKLLARLLGHWHDLPYNHQPQQHEYDLAALASSAGPVQLLHQPQPSSVVLLQTPVCHTPCDTFGDLFQWLLLQHGMLCCGLYRHAMYHSRLLHYVYTNPHKDTELHAGDRAFVLVPLTNSKAQLPL